MHFCLRPLEPFERCDLITDIYKLVYSLFQKVVHRWHVPVHVHAGSPNVHRGWGLPLPTDGLLLMLGNVTPLGVLLPGTDRGEGGALPIFGAHKISFHQTHNQGLSQSNFSGS